VKNGISYKNCLIRAESFQREKNGTWLAQYNVVRQEGGGKGTGFPSSQYQFDTTFPTEGEADAYAVGRAMEWVDSN